MTKSHGIHMTTSVIVSCLTTLFTLGCAPSFSSATYAANPIANRETLSQVSTINALMAGVYDGIITSGELKGYGDFGIGTFDGLDGEMVELDGNLYQVKSDGTAHKVADAMTLPFAEVTFFDNDWQEAMIPGTTLAQLQMALDRMLPSPNIFCAIKITGTFGYVKTRSVPKQVKPYPVLTEVTKNQSIFEFNNVTGTIVGFRCPTYVSGVNVPGYHLHFLTSDLKAGGHILDLITDTTTTVLDFTPNFMMMLPGMSSDFYKVNLSGDQDQGIQQAEK